MSGGVLFFDLSTNVGWAYGQTTDRLPTWGVWKLKPPSEDFGATFSGFQTELLDALDWLKPARVGVERPIPQRSNNVVTAEVTYGLHAILALTCHIRELPLSRPAVGSIRSKVIGRSKLTELEKQIRGATVKKLVVLPWCERVGWGGITEPDARDAAVGWAYEVGWRAVKPKGRRLAA